MRTVDELDAEIAACGWRVRVSVGAVVTLFVLRRVFEELAFAGEDYDPAYHWASGFALVGAVCALVAAAWFAWRVKRLEDAWARTDTMARLTGDENARVGVLGESEPPTKRDRCAPGISRPKT